MDTANTLYLPLKREYFEQIRDRTKPEEYRLCTSYWSKRLQRRNYDQICFTLGYPAKGDMSRRVYRKWRGYSIKKITHEHFGPDPVEVFAIITEG